MFKVIIGAIGAMVTQYIISRVSKLNLSRIDKMHHNKGKQLCDLNRHAIICMIDLCNFSKWCDNKDSETIMYKMFQYDCMIREMLNTSQYHLLEKIEIVGDCAMVIGWTCNDNGDKDMISMMNFATDMLNSIDTIKNIFDYTVSIRIGIHQGDASSGFMSNPRKFQVFGKTVNVASRIESSASNGTCLVSNESVSDDNKNLIQKGELSYTLRERGSFDFKGVSQNIACSQLIPNKRSTY
jgi:class 3 adenylate cyclase